MGRWVRRIAVALAAAVVLLNAGGIMTVRLQAGVERRPAPEELLAPLPFRVDLEPVRIPSADGVQLDGWFMPGSPAGPVAKRASVLVLPGSGMAGHPDAALKYGPMLTEEGYNVLSFSYRGRGHSTGSTRNGVLLGLESLIDDANAALAYLRARPGIGDQPVAALGCSLGTGVALGLAARTDDLRALILDSPWAEFVSSQESQAELGGRGWHNRIPFFWHLLRWWASVAFQLDVDQTEPMKLLAETGRVPLFLIHRTEDPVLHAREAERLYAHASGPKQIWLVPGRGHCDARYAAEPEFPEQVRAFLRQHLRGGESPGFSVSQVDRQEREMVVTVTNQTGRRLPLAATMHRPGRREAPQEYKLWLEASAQPQGYLLPITSPPEFISVLRRYHAQDRGPTWTEDLTPDAQAWRKMGEAESFAARGEVWEGRWAYEAAQRLAPNNSRVHYETGVYLFSHGWYTEASDAFTKALLAPLPPPQAGPDPREWQALSLVYVGRIFDLKDDRRSALGSYRQAKEFGIPSADALADEGIKSPYRAKGG